MTVQQSLQIALGHLRADRRADAEAVYRQILAVEPHHPEALYYLGVIARVAGRLDETVQLMRRVIALSPQAVQPRIVLGDVLLQMQNYPAAVTEFRATLALQQNLPETWLNLGAALHYTGDLQAAIEAYRQALRHRPGLANAYSNLAEAYRSLGRIDDAMAAARQAITVEPNHSQAWNVLGNCLLAIDRPIEAIAAYESAIRAEPAFPEAYNNLGNALRNAGRHHDSLAAYRKAIQLRPDYASAMSNVAYALWRAGQLEEAQAMCRAAIAVNPQLPEAWVHLGNVMWDERRLDDAADAYRKAISLRPQFTEPYNNLGNILREQGRIDEALPAYDAALKANPNYATAGSNRLFGLHFHPKWDGAAILRDHRAWAKRFADPLAPANVKHPNDRSPHRKLRIGYVSADFREHPAGRFMRPLLENHDRAERFEIFAYSDVVKGDELTQLLRSHCDHWRETSHLSYAALAERIREDQIDILVDLAAHSGQNRLPTFARRPAPVQVTYLGYPGTTGMAAMDWRLTDQYLDPPDDPGRFYSERSARLNTTYWCYRAPDEAPDVAPLPTDQPITFGCLNVFAKVSEEALKAWAKILSAVPGSQIVIHADAGRYLDRARSLLASHGIASERIEFLARVPVHQYYAAYNHIHIALDPFPYAGGTTSCDTLWMGVPVVSLVGDVAVRRAGLSLLSRVGLADLAVNDVENYIAKAIELAGDTDRLAFLRRELRERMRQSPVMDAAAFARDVERLYRVMWVDWCNSA